MIACLSWCRTSEVFHRRSVSRGSHMTLVRIGRHLGTFDHSRRSVNTLLSSRTFHPWPWRRECYLTSQLTKQREIRRGEDRSGTGSVSERRDARRLLRRHQRSVCGTRRFSECGESGGSGSDVCVVLHAGRNWVFGRGVAVRKCFLASVKVFEYRGGVSLYILSWRFEDSDCEASTPCKFCGTPFMV